MAITIEYVDTGTASEDLLLRMHELYVVLEALEPPYEPATPVEMHVARWRNVPSFQAVPRWLAWDDGKPIATGGAAVNKEQNLENGYVFLRVLPEYRGQGLGRRIMTPVLNWLEADGRIRMAVSVIEDWPEEELAQRAGLSKVYHERMSRIVVDEVDRDLMQSWIDRASDRAGEYRSMDLGVPFPDAHLDAFCEATRIMHTAPMEDMVEEHEVITPEMWRETEMREAESGNQIHCRVAVHEPTGHFAGYTMLNYQSLHPERAWQWDTAVDPAHRNKGLGRWLKAGLFERFTEMYPEVRWIDTNNAGSNDAMLAINVAMGFAPVLDENVWQGMISDVRTNLNV